MDKINFLKLTPETNGDISTYKEALDYVFDKENKDVKNIAISGSYGSGKTSVLETYKSEEKDKRFIHISLARFNENAVEDTSVDLKEKEENQIKGNAISEIALLEGKILNQLIHQIDPKNISQTDFSIKTKTRSWDILKTFVPLLIIIISIGHLTQVDHLERFISNINPDRFLRWISFLTNNETIFISVSLLICGLSFLLWQIIKMQKQKSLFKKLNIQGNEIEIFSDSNDSLFDKYLNEVIYLFTNSGVDAIVFEDIDRYEEVKIFERLREINTLINLSTYKKAKLSVKISKYTAKCPRLHNFLEERIYKKNKPIKFFYLIRDDIFTSKDRTKFFDFILPVVPVVDSSNSYDKLTCFLGDMSKNNQPEEIFLQEISTYIDDMRLLKNICNEYLIYAKRLDKLELSSNIMFAMTVYKNIFPKDFSDLQLRKGYVFTLFQSKNKLISEQILALNNKIETLQKNIDIAKKEISTSESELIDIFTERKQRNSHYSGRCSKYDHNQDNYDLYENEYDLRLSVVTSGREKCISNCNEQIRDIKQKLLDINSLTIKQILENINIEDLFKNLEYINQLNTPEKYEKIKENEYFNLLKFLVTEGYLNESYNDYMTYFYEKSMCKQDMDFVLSIFNRNKKEYTYRLKEIDKILQKLSVIRFEQSEVLNFDLLEYLLKNSENHIELERFLTQLKETQNIEFISLYFDTERECELFIKHLNSNWSSFFKYSLSNTFNKEQLHKYSIFTLYYSSNEDIELVNTDSSLTNYISEKSDYLNIHSPNINRLIEVFKLLDVSFASVESSVADRDLLEAVYENDLYVLNKANIDMMIDLYYGEFSRKDKKHKNHTIVLSQKESGLYKYVESNIVDYITLILETSDNNIEDDECTFISVLNHLNILIEQKIQYIGIQTNNIKEISEIADNSLWDELLIKAKAEYTETNILDYFLRDKKINTILVDFINNNQKELNYARIADSIYSKEQKQQFFVEIISCLDLNNEKYQEIVLSLGFVYTDTIPENIEYSKLMILINEKVIKFTKQTLFAMRSTYPEAIFDFIILNIDEYVDVMTSQIFVMGEFIELASNEAISTQIKIDLLQHTTEKIKVVGTNYPDELKLAILKSNRDDAEIPDLLNEYDSYCAEIQMFLIELARPRLNSIENKSISVPFNLIKRLTTDKEINESNKVSVFTSQVEKLSLSEIKDLLTVLDFKEMLEVLNRTSDILVEVTGIHKRILDVFVSADIIYNYEEIMQIETRGGEDVQVKYYRVVKVKPRAEELSTEML